MYATPARPRGLDPIARDALLALGATGLLLVGAALNSDPGAHVDALAVLTALATCAPVAFRTVAPMPALAALVAGVFVSLATFKPMASVLVPTALVLYTVAVTGTRRRTLLVAAASVACTTTAVMINTTHPPLGFEALQKAGLVLLALLLGETIREHRAFMQAMRERTERAERTRDEEARRRVGEERLRISREIHDAVAHAMVAINVQSGVAAHLLDRRPEAARDALHEIKRVSGAALNDLRTTLGVLRDDAAPAPTRPSPGLALLDELAQHLQAAGVEVEIDRRGARDQLPSTLDATGFRIVQEGLTNILRHSAARLARVRIDVAHGDVTIEVEDDGPYRATPEPGSGTGLLGMRERAQAVGGVVEAGPRPEGGWLVRARLPLAVRA